MNDASMTDDAATRRALGDFLRACRARRSPAALGLPPGGRRRTPGLRREEVAQAAGLSATWITWIEQARPVAVSAAALDRLARALALAPAERAYLFALAGRADPRAAEAPADDVPEALVRAVAGFAHPAYVLDRTWTVRAWNRAAEALFAGWLDRPGERNLLRWLFLDPGARALVDDWAGRARRVLAEFRADQGRHLDDPAVAGLVAGLAAASPPFAAAWEAQDVLARAGGLRAFRRADGTVARWRQTTLDLAHRPDVKLVLLVPDEPEAGPGRARSRRGAGRRP